MTKPPPWRSRTETDSLCAALVNMNATDAQAADYYAEVCVELERRLVQVLETTAQPIRFVIDSASRPA